MTLDTTLDAYAHLARRYVTTTDLDEREWLFVVGVQLCAFVELLAESQSVISRGEPS